MKAQQEKGPRKLLLLPNKQNFQAEKQKLNKLSDLLSDVIDELIAFKTSDNSSLFTVMTERHQLLNQQLQALNSSADRTQNIFATIDRELLKQHPKPSLMKQTSSKKLNANSQKGAGVKINE